MIRAATRGPTRGPTFGIGERVAGGSPAFDPASLFANGELGSIEDATDFANLFQTSAGSPAVTALQQFVGYCTDLTGLGYNATQATSGFRPTISGRKNFALYTSSVGNIASGAWTTVGTGPTITLNDATDPDGGSAATTLAYTATGTGNRLVQNVARLGFGNFTGIVSIYLRGTVGGELIALWDGQIAPVELPPLTTSWVRYSLPAAAVATGSVNCLLYAVSGTPTIEAWGLQIEEAPPLASTPSFYQPIVDGTSYSGSGVTPYILYDGVDDKLTTTFPDLGTDVTIASLLPGLGVVIQTGQTIGAGAWDDTTNFSVRVIVNRALTGKETSDLTAWLLAKEAV